MFTNRYYISILPALAIGFALSLSSCAPSSRQSLDPGVKSIGSMRAAIWDGELGSKVSLDDLRDKTPHLYAVGPLEFLSGEVTIIDGQTFYSEVTASGPRVFDETGQGAPFLAYASVNEWREPVVLPLIEDLDALEEAIGQAADEAGLDANLAFPVLIEATIRSADAHIVNHRSTVPITPDTHEGIKVHHPITNAPARIIGFYSTTHQGVFVHHDRRTHLHLVTDDKQFAGHVDGVSLVKGARLYLPVKQITSSVEESP